MKLRVSLVVTDRRVFVFPSVLAGAMKLDDEVWPRDQVKIETVKIADTVRKRMKAGKNPHRLTISPRDGRPMLGHDRPLALAVGPGTADELRALASSFGCTVEY